MPQTPSGIEYFVSNGQGGQNPTGRKEHWVKGLNQATEILHLDWADWDQFTVDLIGDAVWEPDGAGGYTLSRTLPMTHPQYPWMVPVDIELVETRASSSEPGDIGDFPEGTTIAAAVTYRSILYQLLDDATAEANGEQYRYVERKVKREVQALAVQGSRYLWADGSGPFIDQSRHGGVLRRYKMQNIEYHWHEVPSIIRAGTRLPVLPDQLIANWDSAAGLVNSQPFDGWPAQTLLCGPIQYEPIVSALGKPMFEVVIPLALQTDGWNNKWRPYGATGEGFYKVLGSVTKGGAEFPFDPYPEVDFNNLLFSAA